MLLQLLDKSKRIHQYARNYSSISIQFFLIRSYVAKHKDFRKRWTYLAATKTLVTLANELNGDIYKMKAH